MGDSSGGGSPSTGSDPTGGGTPGAPESSDTAPGSDSGGSDSSGSPSDTGTGADPGFGDSAGSGLELPSLIDDVPTPSSSSSSSASDSSSSGSNSSSAGSSGGDAQGDTSSDSEGSASGGAGSSIGTRASGGLEPDWGSAEDAMTTAERVAILDRQLEQSTGVFDAILRDERDQQRETERAQGATQPAQTTAETSSGRNPYETADSDGYGSVGGGMGGRRGGAPPTPAIYEAPDDIPEGNDDDVVARQLREAAMREPDPEVRDRLWNEYRKYKGLEIPEE